MDRLLRRRIKNLDSRVLKPTLRAYALGYLTTTGPRVVSFIRILRRKDLSNEVKVRHLAHILVAALRWNRFPSVCALLAAGSTLLPLLLNRVIAALFNRQKSKRVVLAVKLSRLLRFVATFVSAWLCFPLLNSRRRPESEPNTFRNDAFPDRGENTINVSSQGRRYSVSTATHPPAFAGRTLDLTLFVVVRAVDVLAFIGHWGIRCNRSYCYVGLVLCTRKLPFSYGRWISEVAQIDPRLIEALRSARRGDWTYGKPKGSQDVLEPMCEDYGWPRVWGDPSQTVPIPCEVVHMGCGPNCEVHAIWRFAKSFRFALMTDLPIQLLLRSRSPSLQGYFGAVKASLRSSTFLGLFVSIFYYSVCLARTRLGPKIFSYEKVTPMMWDSGLCVASGCMMCGWSVFVESAKKRQEISLFVAPRAIATLLPRRYDRKHMWREQLAFSLGTAIVLTCIQSDPKKVRGVLGGVLRQVFGKA
ncbi:hypothetical protein CISG_09537 [Coccidioides immitis RMSCC 3703]|uniref:Integral membrane protein n=1 Tax=Coccidioides immitis RMSCC 3703 TaxID=454286 RepID=A0A0J8QJB7_COCIT|nr:hypothetical protein CISG_09537 [Coccidioides immitis RMSCC 3703]